MKLGEFFVELGLKGNTPAVRDFSRSITDLTSSMTRAVLDIAAVNLSLAEIARQAITAATGIQSFEAQTGRSGLELQKWQIRAQMANVTADTMTQSVMGLERALAGARLGQGDVGAMTMLGISPFESAFTALERLRSNPLLKSQPAMAGNLMSRVGLSPDLIQMLTLSEDKWRQYTNAVHGMTRDQVGDFLKLKETLTGIGLSFKFGAFDFLDNLVDGGRRLNGLLHENNWSLKVFAGSIALLGAALAPVTALMALFLLALEDIAVYTKGGNSVFGDFVNAWKTIFQSPREDLQVILDLLKKVSAWSPDLFGGGLRSMLGGGFNPLMPMGSGFRQLQMSNTFTISGLEKGAEELADIVVRKLKEWTSAAEQQIGNGGH